MAPQQSTIVLGVVAVVVAMSVTGYVGVGASTPQTHGAVDDGPSDVTLAQPTPSNNTTAPSEAEIERRALTNGTPVESFVGTVAVTSDVGNETQTTRAQVWQRPPDDVRFEYLSGPTAGDVFVSNGSTFWYYNESANTVFRFQYPPGLLQGLTQASQKFPPLYTAEYVGEANVSSQETYVVSLEPPAGPLGRLLGNQTVWLDQDNWFPVQTRTTNTVGNTTSTTTITYSNLTYNASIPDDRFRFEPPENASVVDVDVPRRPWFDSVDAAERAANVSVRHPG